MSTTDGIKLVKKVFAQRLMALEFSKEGKVFVCKRDGWEVVAWIELLGQKSPGLIDCYVGIHSEPMMKRMGVYFPHVKKYNCLIETSAKLYDYWRVQDGKPTIGLGDYPCVLTLEDGQAYLEKINHIFFDEAVPAMLSFNSEAEIIDRVSAGPRPFSSFYPEQKWKAMVELYHSKLRET